MLKLKPLQRCFSKYYTYQQFMQDLNKHQSTSNIIYPNRQIYSYPFSPSDASYKFLQADTIRPPLLKHNLHKIVRQQGIYPASQFTKLNQDPFVQKIPKFTQNSLKRIHNYRPPSQDLNLLQKANLYNCKFITGSSSITDALNHIYFSLFNFKSPNIVGLGNWIQKKHVNYMGAYRKPNTFFLRKIQDGKYAIDGDNGFLPPSNKVLLDMGLILETMVTTEKSLLFKVLDQNYKMTKQDITQIQNAGRSYRYRQMGNTVVRSQIDCGGFSESGQFFVFEIKTRAVAPIRYDVQNHSLYTDYQITRRSGFHTSYQREFYDLIRSILFKYFIQILLGRMDGAFLVYHNTIDIFGFEYISLKEIEKRLFGSSDFSEFILKSCMMVLNEILEQVTSLFGDSPMLKIGIYANYRYDQLMITVQTYDQIQDWKEVTQKIPGVENQYDYYKKFRPNKSAFAFGKRVFPILNGIVQKEPIFLEKGDELCWNFLDYYKGQMSFTNYMQFLHEAYKLDYYGGSKDYSGSFKRFNDYYVFKKQVTIK